MYLHALGPLPVAITSRHSHRSATRPHPDGSTSPGCVHLHGRVPLPVATTTQRRYGYAVADGISCHTRNLWMRGALRRAGCCCAGRNRLTSHAALRTGRGAVYCDIQPNRAGTSTPFRTSSLSCPSQQHQPSQAAIRPGTVMGHSDPFRNDQSAVPAPQPRLVPAGEAVRESSIVGVLYRELGPAW